MRRRHDFYRTIQQVVKQNLWRDTDMGDVRPERTWEMSAQNETVDFLPYTYTYTYTYTYSYSYTYSHVLEWCPISGRTSVYEYA